MYEERGDQRTPVSDRVVDRIAAAIDALLALDLDELDILTDDELRSLMVAVERQGRWLPAFMHRLMAVADQRLLARRIGLRDTAGLLRKDLRLSAGEARARCRAMDHLVSRKTPAGRRLEPSLARAALAQSAGDLSVAQVRVIQEAVERLPEVLRESHVVDLEARLVGDARRLDPARLAQRATQLLAEFDVDQVRRRVTEHERLRGATFVLHPDGSADLRAHLTPVGAAIVQAGLMPLAAPRPDDAGGRDERTAIQRGHDALVEAFRRLVIAKEIPGEGGVPATVIVTVPLADVQASIGPAGAGTATTQYGGVLSIHDLLRLAGEALVVPVVVDEHQAPLHVGRAKRFATKGQTYALIARDQGCSFPDCDHPPPWTERHHIVAWLHGGRTDIDNLTLLCGYHHANFERLGWECAVIDGIVYWRPPATIDPLRRPIRNTAHDQPSTPEVEAPAEAA